MVLWYKKDKKLGKHLRYVLSVSNNSPISPAAFSGFKAVIKEIENEKIAGVGKTEGIENTERIEKAGKIKIMKK